MTILGQILGKKKLGKYETETFDRILIFDKYIASLCKKAG